MRSTNAGSRRRWGHRCPDGHIMRVEEGSESRGNPDGPSFVSEIAVDGVKHLKQFIYREI